MQNRSYKYIIGYITFSCGHAQGQKHIVTCIILLTNLKYSLSKIFFTKTQKQRDLWVSPAFTSSMGQYLFLSRKIGIKKNP